MVTLRRRETPLSSLPEASNRQFIAATSFGVSVPEAAHSRQAPRTGRMIRVHPNWCIPQVEWQDIADVVWDRGYSHCLPRQASTRCDAGINVTFRPMEAQRKRVPFTTEAIVLEGVLFSSHLPAELQEPLPMPPDGALESVKERYEKPFNLRARHRFQHHAGPDTDGTTRWRCPYCSRFLRSKSIPKTMRRPATVPRADLPPTTACCAGVVSASAEELPHWQQFTPGTTAWRISTGTASARRRCECRPQEQFREHRAEVHARHGPHEDDHHARLHDRGTEPRDDPLLRCQGALAAVETPDTEEASRRNIV